jgi:hypothetical protein
MCVFEFCCSLPLNLIQSDDNFSFAIKQSTFINWILHKEIETKSIQFSISVNCLDFIYSFSKFFVTRVVEKNVGQRKISSFRFSHVS